MTDPGQTTETFDDPTKEKAVLVPQEAAMLHTGKEICMPSPGNHLQAAKLARTEAGTYYTVKGHLTEALEKFYSDVPSTEPPEPFELASTLVSPELIPQPTPTQQCESQDGQLQGRDSCFLTTLPDSAFEEQNSHTRSSSSPHQRTEIQRSRPLSSPDWMLPTELPPEGSRGSPPVAELPVDSNSPRKVRVNSLEDAYRSFRAVRRLSAFENSLEKLKLRRNSGSLESPTTTLWFLSARDNEFRSMQELLVTGTDVNKGNPADDGRTALHYAAQQRHLDLAKWLLDKKAKVKTRDKLDQTALHEAAKSGGPEIIDLFVHAGANVNALRNDGSSPLHLAASKGHKAAVKSLLDAQADPTIKRYDGRTPLQLSIVGAHTSVSKVLQAACAKVMTDKENHWPGLN